MKISTKAVSPYLNQEDVPQPIVATMDRVTLVPALRNPHVLHFQGGVPKPVPLNLTNRRALVALFGDDDANWVGKPIEIYVDPNVNDSKGNRTGGIRLRAPAQRPTVAAPKATVAAPVAKKATVNENFAMGMKGMDEAQTRDRLDAWAIALGRLPLDETQKAAAQRRYDQSVARVAMRT